MLHRILDEPAEVAPADAIARAAAGSGVVVGLDAGSLGEAAALAAGAGMDVLHAHGGGGGGSPPFGVALQLLRPAVDRLDERERAAALSGAAALAAPALSGGSSDPASELAVRHGLYWLISNLADRTPLALFVEDALSADEPSLRLLAALTQRIDELPVVLVVT